jgi:hydroxypyruvate isomerase
MTKFAANVGFLYPELPYLERIAAARAAGFEAIETRWPPVPTDAFRAAVRMSGMHVAQLNVAAGDLDAGERGHVNDPTAIDRWRADFDAALRLAAAVECPVLTVLAGNRSADATLDDQWTSLRENLGWALPRARREGQTVVVEMLNPLDEAAYLVTDLDTAAGILGEFGSAGLRFQFDAYHVGRMTSDVSGAYRSVAPAVAHVQVADVPGRHEPGTGGGVDWAGFFAVLAEIGYDGAVGLEYRPLGDTSAGLDWLPRPARRWTSEPFIPVPA